MGPARLGPEWVEVDALRDPLAAHADRGRGLALRARPAVVQADHLGQGHPRRFAQLVLQQQIEFRQGLGHPLTPRQPSQRRTNPRELGGPDRGERFERTRRHRGEVADREHAMRDQRILDRGRELPTELVERTHVVRERRVEPLRRTTRRRGLSGPARLHLGRERDQLADRLRSNVGQPARRRRIETDQICHDREPEARERPLRASRQLERRDRRAQLGGGRQERRRCRGRRCGLRPSIRARRRRHADGLLESLDRRGRVAGTISADRRQRAREPRRDPRDRLRVVAVRKLVGLNRRTLVGLRWPAPERVRAGEQLVEHQGRREQVARRCPPVVHVHQRIFVADAADGEIAVDGQPSGEPDVEQLGHRVDGEHDVVGLDVAVDPPGLVQRAERSEQPTGHAEEPAGIERITGRGPQRRREAFDELEHEEVAVLERLDVVEPDQVRMGDRAEDPSLFLEVVGVVRIGDLQHDRVVGLELSRFPGRRGRAAAEPLDQLVGLADLGAGGELGPLRLMGEHAQRLLEPIGHDRGIERATGRFDGQELGDEVGDRPRTGAIADGQRRHHERPQDLVDVREQGPAGEQLHQRGAEREQVRTRRRLAGLQHVRRRAAERGIAQRAAGDRGRDPGEIARQLERTQADLGRVIFVGDQHRLGRQAAVDQTLLVDPGERPHDPRRHVEARAHAGVAILDPRVHRLERRGVLELQHDALGVVARDEVGVVAQDVSAAAKLAVQRRLAQRVGAQAIALGLGLADDGVRVQHATLARQAGALGQPGLEGTILGGQPLHQAEVVELIFDPGRLAVVEVLLDRAALGRGDRRGVPQPRRIDEGAAHAVLVHDEVFEVARDLCGGVGRRQEHQALDPDAAELSAAGL